MFNEKQKKPFVLLSFISHIITVISYCCLLAQAIEALNRADVNLFCHDTGSKQGWPIFFPFLSVSLFISKTKTFILRKQAVKAAKSNRLSLRRVEICLQKIHSLRCHFMQN